MERVNSVKIFGSILAVFILVMLIISVPARALTLNLSASKSNVQQGDKVQFDVSVNYDPAVNTIAKVVLQLDGPEKVKCEFSAEGIILSGCKGISVQKTSGLINYTQGSGYGYGYGYDTPTPSNIELKYKMTLDTSNYKLGDYKTKLVVYNSDNEYTFEGKVLTIESDSIGGDYEPGYHSNRERICLTGWKCSEWSECEDGTQTRECEMLANCYLENKPAEQRLCIEENSTKMFNGLVNILRIGNKNEIVEKSEIGQNIKKNNLSQVKISNESLLVIVIFAIVLLILIMIGIIFGVLISRKARMKRKIRELQKIRYIPKKEY